MVIKFHYVNSTPSPVLRYPFNSLLSFELYASPSCGAHPSPFLPLPTKSSISSSALSLSRFPSLAPPTPPPQHLLLFFALFCLQPTLFCGKGYLIFYSRASGSSLWLPLLFLPALDSLEWEKEVGILCSSFPFPDHCPSNFPWMTPLCSVFQRLKSNSFSMLVYGLHLYISYPFPLPLQTVRNSFLCPNCFYGIPTNYLDASLSFSHFKPIVYSTYCLLNLKSQFWSSGKTREIKAVFTYWSKLKLFSLASKAPYNMSQHLTPVLSFHVVPFNQYRLCPFPVLCDFLLLTIVLIAAIYRALCPGIVLSTLYFVNSTTV